MMKLKGFSSDTTVKTKSYGQEISSLVIPLPSVTVKARRAQLAV